MTEAPKDPEDGRPFSFALLAGAHSVASDLSRYVDLSHDIENMLAQKEKAIERQLRVALKSAPVSCHQDIVEDFGWEIHPYQSVFPFLQRESMFVTLYSYFEFKLNELCAWVGEEIGSRVGLKDIQGRGVERALLFLERVPEFQFTRIPAVMQEIRGANLLRNAIVHAGTELPEEPNHALNRYVTGHAHLSGKPGQGAGLRREFVAAFAGTLKAFFEEFQAEMQRYMDRTWRKELAAQAIQ